MLTQKEARMAELLEITHSVDDNVKGAYYSGTGANDKMRGIRENVQFTGKRVQIVDDKVQGIDNKVRDVGNRCLASTTR
jgi:hypothetical protein